MSFSSLYFFFFNDTATTEIYTLSLHDALPICSVVEAEPDDYPWIGIDSRGREFRYAHGSPITDRELALLGRSEEHTSELQSRQYLVCRLLLEKKKPHA